MDTMNHCAPVDVRLRDGDLKNISNEIRAEVYRWMLETRTEKFRDFLWWLQKFRYGACSCLRGNLMEHYYCALRFPDDVADGHHPLPDGYATRPDYVEERLAFARDPTTPKDAIDQLLQHCYHLAEQLGFSLKIETQHMLESILFDALRRGKNIVFPKDILEKNFFALDIDGTISASLKIFGEDPAYCRALQALGTATRKYYNGEDFRIDVDQDGLINIPEGDMMQFGISPAALHDPHSSAVRSWLQHEAQEGMVLLDTHEKTMKSMSLRRLTRFTLKNVYQKPARKFFTNELNVHRLP
ncbi:hypothetical protein HY213_05820 [Candidatus Peregrinibacteria bacterium]|nr:hypothetical protein [Candidatus Peregrinibacteria bacterium]